MKTAIVYYTHYGNSAVVAHVLSSRYGCDVIQLTERKKRKNGAFGFMNAGFQAAISKKSKLAFDVKEKLAPYDRLIIITPVWASRQVPAINTLLSEVDFSQKGVVLFTIQGDPEHAGAPKIAQKVQLSVEEKGGHMISSHYLHNKSLKTVVTREEIESQLQGFFDCYKPLD